MTTKKQKQERLAADMTAKLGPNFDVHVEDQQVWVQYSATAGQAPFARVLVPLDRRDWRTSVPADYAVTLADAATERFKAQRRDPRITEDAAALALTAYLTACAPAGTDISEDAFEEHFRPMAGPSAGGDPVQTFEQVKGRPVEYVWTLVDADGDICAAPGFHVVNNVGYVVTEVPWLHEGMCAAWDVRDDPDEEDAA